MARVYLILMALMAGQASWGLELYTWQPHSTRPPMIIGVEEGQTSAQAARDYVRSLNEGGRYPNLKSLFSRSPLPQLNFKNFKKLTDKDFDRRVLLMANRPEDLSADDWRVPTFSEPFAAEDMPAYLIPFALDAAMNDKASKQLIELINQKFSRFIAMGGDDLSGVHWGDSDQGSVNFNADRDAFEVKLFTEKYRLIRSRNLGEHRIFGTCRGLQLVGRIAGHKIFSHVDGHGGIDEGASSYRQSKVEPNHPIQLLPTQNAILQTAVEDTEIKVNSYHHKYLVKKRSNSYLQLAAISKDGIPEAYESKDGRILLVQFHPELMRTRSQGALAETGNKIMRAAARFLLHGPTCENQLSVVTE